MLSWCPPQESEDSDRLKGLLAAAVKSEVDKEEEVSSHTIETAFLETPVRGLTNIGLFLADSCV